MITQFTEAITSSNAILMFQAWEVGQPVEDVIFKAVLMVVMDALDFEEGHKFKT